MEKGAAGSSLETLKKSAQMAGCDRWVIMMLAEWLAKTGAELPDIEFLPPVECRRLLAALLEGAKRKLRSGAPLHALLSIFRAKGPGTDGGLPPGGMSPVT
jgi:hypothetical protein